MEQDIPFDFESYIGNYSGRTKITRALFIAKNSDDALATEAKRWALGEIQRETLDKDLYVKVAKDLEIEPDDNWVQSTQREYKVQSETLENELKAQKAQMSKENIRLATVHLGDFYFKAGDMNAALRHYVRTRDYCSNPQHIVDMCLNVIRVHIEQKHFSQITSYIARAEATPNISDREHLRSKLECCRALCALADRDDYGSAANALMNVGPEVGNTFNHILSANDIAVYGGLCALASFDREQLRTKTVQNPAFKTYVEHEPQIQEMIDAFYSSKYTTCLQLLDAYKSNLRLDIYLAPHVDKLVAQIRERAMVQYCQPYSTVDLNRMATVFMVPVNQLQKELAELISQSNRISALIDSHKKVLQRKKRDQRTIAVKRSLETGTQYEKSAKALIFRMKLVKAQLVVK